MAKRRAKLVEVRHGHPGHVLSERGKRHNTAGYSGDQEDVLADVLKDNLSPEGGQGRHRPHGQAVSAAGGRIGFRTPGSAG
jgi:hypothetical protein